MISWSEDQPSDRQEVWRRGITYNKCVRGVCSTNCVLNKITVIVLRDQSVLRSDVKHFGNNGHSAEKNRILG